eukprot:3015508-Amphidinium_carterae.1
MKVLWNSSMREVQNTLKSRATLTVSSGTPSHRLPVPLQASTMVWHMGNRKVPLDAGAREGGVLKACAFPNKVSGLALSWMNQRACTMALCSSRATTPVNPSMEYSVSLSTLRSAKVQQHIALVLRNNPIKTHVLEGDAQAFPHPKRDRASYVVAHASSQRAYHVCLQATEDVPAVISPPVQVHNLSSTERRRGGNCGGSEHH